MRYCAAIAVVVMCACYLHAPEQTELPFHLNMAAIKAEADAIARERDKNEADAAGMPDTPARFSVVRSS